MKLLPFLPGLILLIMITLFFRTSRAEGYDVYYRYTGGSPGRILISPTVNINGRTFSASTILSRDTRMRDASIQSWNNIRFIGNLPLQGHIFKNVSSRDTCPSNPRDWSAVTAQGFTYDADGNIYFVDTNHIQKQRSDTKCCGDCGRNKKTLANIGCPADGHMGAPAYVQESFSERDTADSLYSTIFKDVLVPLEKCGNKHMVAFNTSNMAIHGKIYFPEVSYRHLAFIAREPMSDLIVTTPASLVSSLDVWSINIGTMIAIGPNYKANKVGTISLVDSTGRVYSVDRVQSVSLRNNTLYILSDYNSGDFMEGDNSKDGVYIFVMERIAGTNNKKAVLRQHIGIQKNESIWQELEGIYAHADRIEVLMQEEDSGVNDGFFKTISVTPV